MNLKNLIFVESEKDREGNWIYRKLDNKELVNDFHLLPVPPILVSYGKNQTSTCVDVRDEPEMVKRDANALLLGGKLSLSSENNPFGLDAFYAASYCRIKT